MTSLFPGGLKKALVVIGGLEVLIRRFVKLLEGLEKDENRSEESNLKSNLDKNGEWIVVSPLYGRRQMLKKCLMFNGVTNIQEMDMEKFIDSLGTFPEEYKNNKKFLIDFYIFDRRGEEMMDYKTLLKNDPFKYPLSDLLSMVIFGKDFYDNNPEKNWFLKNAYFVGHININSNNNQEPKIEIKFWKISRYNLLEIIEPKILLLSFSKEKLEEQFKKELSGALEHHS